MLFYDFYELYLKNEKRSLPGGRLIEQKKTYDKFPCFLRKYERGNNISAASAFYKQKCQTIKFKINASSYKQNDKRGDNISAAGTFSKQI